ncbi:MAG: 3'-5' exonuclease [bacterium]|nr:3'-5' exonuclease [bacterium]
MDYIIVDLEWNQSPDGKGTELKEIPFEIIEIGAVKVDENNKCISEFHEYIYPTVYSELHHHTQELLQIDRQRLELAAPFPDVIKRFFDWCGEEFMFGTWGAMDLTELQKNLRYYNLSELLMGPIRFYDIQKLFSLQFDDKKNAHTLEYAVDYMNLEKHNSFHSAIHDARYTAEVFIRLERELRRNFSIDSFCNPKTKNEEIYVVFDTYSKYISREFDTKEQAIEDRDVKGSVCYVCGKKAAKKIKWFSSNTKNYYCLAYCRTHGYMKGKIRMKKTETGKVYAIKVLKLVDEEGANAIRDKQRLLRIKRKERRNRKRTI